MTKENLAVTRFFLKVLTKPNDLDDCLAEATKDLTHPVRAPLYSDVITKSVKWVRVAMPSGGGAVLG